MDYYAFGPIFRPAATGSWPSSFSPSVSPQKPRASTSRSSTPRAPCSHRRSTDPFARRVKERPNGLRATLPTSPRLRPKRPSA
ncbi:hypothetical protein CSW63_01050 (plasmid) [Caulobacter sp. FWC26]|nr:hypothetical protein CSW63_01050 [Caulobacter sp. FWC26]